MHGFGQISGGAGDPGAGNATGHGLHETLVIALLCMTCGGQACAGMELSGRPEEAFLRRFMKTGHGIPGHGAFPGLSTAPGPGCLRRVPVRPVPDWAVRPGPDVTAAGGKALRRSSGDAPDRSPPHAGRDHGDAGASGLPGVKGMAATGGATGARRDTAKRTTQAGGNRLLAMEGNQETLHDGVWTRMADPENAGKTLGSSDAGKGRGGAGIRETVAFRDAGAPQGLHRWPGLQAVAKAAATREAKGERSTKPRFFPPSGTPGPERLLKAVRRHRAAGKPAPPGSGRDQGRGRPWRPERQRSREAGDGPGADGRWRESGAGARKAGEGRPGRRLPADPLRFGDRPRAGCRNRQNPNAIALARIRPEPFTRRRHRDIHAKVLSTAQQRQGP